MKLRYRYWTKSPGIGGRIEREEDFVVREIINPKFLRKFNSGGKYVLFLVKKKNMTTHEAVRALARQGWRDIGYAGLKDRFSVSWQYMSAMAEERDYTAEGLAATVVGKSKKIFKGDLIGNEFVITLRGCKSKTKLYDAAKELCERGVPNYFGLQRFGNNQDNHVIGRHLVKRKFNEALDAINKNFKKKTGKIENVPKQMLKFFINAYQSWIFNEALNRYMSKNRKPCFRDAPLIGYGTAFGRSVLSTIAKNICRKEGIKQKDFRINELMITCLGGERKAFVDLKNISYIIGANTVRLGFVLPKGSYGTIVLRELCK